MVEDIYSEYPICEKCGEPMIYSFCLSGCEFVCIPCGVGLPYFNGNNKVRIKQSDMKKLKEKYKKDIHKLSFKKGGAYCMDCNKFGGNNCKTCDIEYDYVFYKKI